MAMPWDVERNATVRNSGNVARNRTYSNRQRRQNKRRTDLSYSGPWASNRNSGNVARNRTFSSSSQGGPGYGSGGGGSSSSRRSSGPSYAMGAPAQRAVQARQAGPLPLTAEEIAAFADSRRAITKQAQMLQAQAARQKAAALEAFKGGRFGLNRQAQLAMRDVAGQAAGRGRGQARSTLQTYRPMTDVDMQRQTGMGTLQSNLSNARAAATSQAELAKVDREAALAKLGQQMALRRSMPRGFFSGLGG